MTGKPLSHFHRKAPHPAFPMLTAALVPEDRAALHERIEERFDAMLAAGLLDEVRQLMAEPGFDANSPAMRAVGYRQAVQFWKAARTMRHFVWPASPLRVSSLNAS